MNKKIVALRAFQVAIIIGIIIVVIAMIANITSPAETTLTTPTTSNVVVPDTSSSQLISKPIIFSDIVLIEFPDKESTSAFIDNCEAALNALTQEIEKENTYTQDAIDIMKGEHLRLQDALANAHTQNKVFDMWEAKEREYGYATRTWKYLKDLGYSDIACAGILGNLMAECGGHTLKLDPYLYDGATGTYYGMFQWSTYWYPTAEGMSFEEQLDYYAQTSISVFKNWGKEYYEGFTIDHFNRLDNPRDAALAFAKVYERCASWTYERRQNFSEIAYEYFVTDFEEVINNG